MAEITATQEEFEALVERVQVLEGTVGSIASNFLSLNLSKTINLNRSRLKNSVFDFFQIEQIIDFFKTFASYESGELINVDKRLLDLIDAELEKSYDSSIEQLTGLQLNGFPVYNGFVSVATEKLSAVAQFLIDNEPSEEE